MSLLETARQTTVKSNHFRLPDYPVPDRIELGRPKFAELVFHVFIICLGEGDNRIPSPIAWPNIFPAYPTLKLYQDDIRTLEYKSQYLSEASNPGITSLLVLPFLEMLKERRDDPLVILAVHMQTLCHVRGSPNIHHDSRWAWDGMVCTEEMEGFINGQEMREWFDCQPTGVKEECEVLVQEMGLVTRNVRMRNTLEKAGLLTP
ncbi:hypothetical protein E1B28_002388 [Marasmius oreades]|uniref:Uncharacterized protein n=1 Tax=Marasmius oreades TaxID=181124 RepID=A0A9P7UNW9_9AGAR|nr:uncharacterized protein E1B28_002388 [Marasmius oreades]KAG7086434.1 hypothetical protein E1B28_002388 [Marasmius oreades]